MRAVEPGGSLVLLLKLLEQPFQVRHQLVGQLPGVFHIALDGNLQGGREIHLLRHGWRLGYGRCRRLGYR